MIVSEHLSHVFLLAGDSIGSVWSCRGCGAQCDYVGSLDLLDW